MAGSVPGDERLHPHSKVTHMRKAITIFISTVLWCFSAMGATPDEVISKVNAAMKERSSVRLDFIQTRHIPLLKENLRSNGSICFAAPQKLRWEVKSPSLSVFILNGSKVMTSSSRGVSIKDISTDRRFQGIARNISRISSGPLVDTRSFDVTVLEGDTEWTIRMIPLRRDLSSLFKEIVLTADKGSHLVGKAVLLDGEGGSTTLEFSNLQFGSELDDNLFAIQ